MTKGDSRKTAGGVGRPRRSSRGGNMTLHQMEGTKRVKITLRGDPANPETAEHSIEFPGGAVHVARTSDGKYWAHITVNRKQAIPDAKGLVSRRGRVVDSRVDTEIGTYPVRQVDAQISHVALLVEVEP